MRSTEPSVQWKKPQRARPPERIREKGGYEGQRLFSGKFSWSDRILNVQRAACQISNSNIASEAGTPLRSLPFSAPFAPLSDLCGSSFVLALLFGPMDCLTSAILPIFRTKPNSRLDLPVQVIPYANLAAGLRRSCRGRQDRIPLTSYPYNDRKIGRAHV